MNGVPGMIRTCDLRFRKPLLYPAELRRRTRRHLKRLGSLAASGALFVTLSGVVYASETADCAPQHLETTQNVIAVAALELTLAPAQKLALSGLYIPPPQQAEAKAEMSRWLAGLKISFNPLSAAPDRYGRIPADVFMSDAAAEYVQARLLRKGLALRLPVSADTPCRAVLAEAEQQARRARAGLWHNEAVVIASSDFVRLTRSSGQFALVEGVLRSVAVRDYAVFFNFSGPWSTAFSAMVLKKNRAAFDKAVSFSDKAGQNILLRGMVETAPRLRMSLQSPESFDFIETP